MLPPIVRDMRLISIRSTQSSNGRRGYAILATTAAIFVLIGMLGLAVDLGRLYIYKSEAQAFADAASILAATKLNGKSSGIDAADAAVRSSVNRYNFSTQTMPSNVLAVEFSQSMMGPWEAPPINNAADYAFVRVSARPLLNLSFLQVVSGATTASALGQAIGGQVPMDFSNGGYLPFTPFALNPTDPTGNFGMRVGEEYAFLWPGNVSRQNACTGNQVNWPQYNFSDNSAIEGSNRGYFELQSAATIRDAIGGAYQMSPLAIGDIISLTNGQKQAMQDALVIRALADTDQTPYPSNSSQLVPNYTGNGMRLVTLPVNSGSLAVPNNQVLGFAAFLLPTSYPNQGNRTWCAIYMGSSVAGGGVSAHSGAGTYTVRLVQ